MTWIERLRVWIREWWDDTDDEQLEQPVHIIHTPGVCGGRAHIVGSRMPVWCLELMRRGGHSIAVIISDHPNFTAEQIQAAWDYADLHAIEIDQDIRDQIHYDFRLS